MKTRSIAITLVLCLAACALSFAQDPNMGSWRLNESKSKLAPGTTRNVTVVYAPAGDSVKVTTDGTDGAGKASHTEWTGKFDGKDYPVVGDPSADSRSYTRVNSSTLRITNKKAGAVTLTGRIVVSEDGKSRTLTTSGTDASGGQVSSTAVYDKQ